MLGLLGNASVRRKLDAAVASVPPGSPARPLVEVLAHRWVHPRGHWHGHWRDGDVGDRPEEEWLVEHGYRVVRAFSRPEKAE